MLQRRGKRLKASKGTIKTYGDPKRVAVLLGIDDKQDVKERKAKEQESAVIKRVPALTHDVRVVVKEYEAPSSDIESLADSVCDSDTFNSSDEMDSMVHSPSLSNLKQVINESVDDVITLGNEVKLPDTGNDLEVQDVFSSQEPKEPDKSHATEKRNSSLKKEEERLPNVQEWEYTLPPIPEAAPEIVPETKKQRYKPRTLTDYRKWKREQEERKLGQLGFDRLNPEYQKRIAKAARQKEYSESIKQCPIKVKHSKQQAIFPVIPEQSKRQLALEYAKKQQTLMPSINKHVQPRKQRNKKSENIMSLVDVMKARHNREKALVDALRQEVAALR